MGFGYSKTKKLTDNNLHTFTFRGTWAEGNVNDYHIQGFSMLKNKCYQTDMRIDSGCSGGPVFKQGYVVGINSTSFEISHEDNPISFITPVEYLLDLQLRFENETFSIRNMIQNGIVVAEF